MLSSTYCEIKRLRSHGDGAKAIAMLRTNPPASDTEAFEAVVCLFVCGDTASSANVCQTWRWKEQWALNASQALAEMLRGGEASRVLSLARAAINDSGAPYDALAICLLLLQVNGQIVEAVAYTVMIGNVHEALGNALRASLLQQGSPPPILQIMRCRNELGDYYGSLAAFDKLNDKSAVAPEIRVELATVWKVYYARGYLGAMLSRGFSPRVPVAVADEFKRAMPRVIGAAPMLQAWGYKYDQRMQGINMHADFAKVNVNFWITPDEACADPTIGGMVVYDLPVPRHWTFADYNSDSARLAAFLKVHNAKPLRVPYRANRCVLFDSSLIHITDEMRFRPGYENRRVNVTMLYGKARTVG